MWTSAHESVCFHFPSMCHRSLGEAVISFLFCSSHSAAGSTRWLFLLLLGLECARLQVLKITKQREAAACKLWMRSWSANTARSDMKGDFVLDSPSVVSHLCPPFQTRLPRAHFKLQLGPLELGLLGKHLSLYGRSKGGTEARSCQTSTTGCCKSV